MYLVIISGTLTAIHIYAIILTHDQTTLSVRVYICNVLHNSLTISESKFNLIPVNIPSYILQELACFAIHLQVEDPY